MSALLFSLLVVLISLFSLIKGAPPSHSSWEQSLLLQQSKDTARLRYLSSLASVRPIVPVAPSWGQNPTYVLRAEVGTPPQSLNVSVDTSSDAAWFSCSGCVGCSSVSFDNAKSSTFKRIPCGAPQCSQVPNPSCGFNNNTCGFNSTYGSSTVSAGLVQDSINLAGNPIPNYTFGCVQNSAGSSFSAQGLLGLGRGPLSLISQTRQLYNSTFSYCLPSYNSTNFSGSLKLGQKFQPVHINSTKLLSNAKRPSLYYVNLVGIRVGSRVVNISSNAFALDNNTGAGTIFDSGTVFSSLVSEAYLAVRDELRRRQQQREPNATVFSLGGFDTCYNTTNIDVPTITFMFPGMNTTLEQENFIIRGNSGTTSCLAIAAANKGVNSVLNVIASFQQQNHRVLVDELNSRLGVSREPCSS